MPQLIHNNQSLTDENYYDDMNAALFAVADGMGGGAHGEIASALVVDSIKQFANGHKNLLSGNLYSFINEAIYAANQSILDHLNDHPEDLSMGSTVILGVVSDGMLYLGWVGDSRCYMIDDKSIKVLSHDHSYVQNLIDEGSITEEEAFSHPNRNIINQSLGMIDIIPSFEKFALEGSQTIVFCSDGLNTMLRDTEIHEICHQHDDLKMMVHALVDAANEAGGNDNISCIAVRLTPNPIQAATISDPKEKTGETTKNNVKKLPWPLIVIGAGLILAFIWVFNRRNHDSHNSTQKMEKPVVETVSVAIPDSVMNTDSMKAIPLKGEYIVRLMVFQDSMKAQMYLDRISRQYNRYSYRINHTPNMLFEVTASGFYDKIEANTFVSKGSFPNAVILFQNYE